MALVVGCWLLIDAASALHRGSSNNHGDIVHRVDRPVTFWALVSFEIFCGLSGLIWAAMGSDKSRKN